MPTYRISKRFDFSASHQLAGLPEDHQCARLHGHNYSVTLFLEDHGLNEVGFVCDYGELDTVKRTIDKTIDHRHLNEVFKFNPTAENIAQWFYKKFRRKFPQLVAVEVKESDKTSAIYTE